VPRNPPRRPTAPCCCSHRAGSARPSSSAAAAFASARRHRAATLDHVAWFKHRRLHGHCGDALRVEIETMTSASRRPDRARTDRTQPSLRSGRSVLKPCGVPAWSTALSRAGCQPGFSRPVASADSRARRLAPPRWLMRSGRRRRRRGRCAFPWACEGLSHQRRRDRRQTDDRLKAAPDFVLQPPAQVGDICVGNSTALICETKDVGGDSLNESI
jgi:hypothetical protein